jgi:hypothetical protein
MNNINIVIDVLKNLMECAFLHTQSSCKHVYSSPLPTRNARLVNYPFVSIVFFGFLDLTSTGIPCDETASIFSKYVSHCTPKHGTLQLLWLCSAVIYGQHFLLAILHKY